MFDSTSRSGTSGASPEWVQFLGDISLCAAERAKGRYFAASCGPKWLLILC